MWHPGAPELAKIRSAINSESTRWKRVTGSKKIREAVEFRGESLKRPPKGYDADHPLIDDLKRKDFIVIANATENDALTASFAKTFATFCKTSSPYIHFLTEAVGLEW